MSIVATAAVAIAVPFFNARLHRTAAREARHAAARDDLSTVIDVASQALAHAEDAMMHATAAVEAESRRSATSAEITHAAEAMAQGYRALKEVREVRHRLATRLGWNADLCEIYDTVLHQLGDELAFVEDVRAGGPAGDNTDAWAEVALALAGYADQYAAGRTAFYEVTATSIELGAPRQRAAGLRGERQVGLDRRGRPTPA